MPRVDLEPCERSRAFQRIVPLIAWVLLYSAGVAAGRQLGFNRDVRPVLSDHCYACHGPDEGKRKAGLRLDQMESALGELESGSRAIVPGRPDLSALVERITQTDPDEIMPPPDHGKPLTREEIETLVQWVDEGAAWSGHWAFMPPVQSEPPAVTNPQWPVNDIDRFVLSGIEKAGFEPAVDADKPTLLRRVTFDLTGLPPSPEEVDAFVADEAPDAYERVVDRLLESDHYGERMTLNWLDLARYADTSGYHFDGVRFMWLWRDWVIDAFNRNKPYDVFTVEQLAGDLLPSPTRDQRIATGFVRNNMTNDEGGADPDEYLNKYVADRVTTLGTVWMGMTVGCAECHDHKFDPLKTKEFYQLYAFFHNVPEKGLDRIRTDNPPPRLPVPTVGQAMEFVEADFRLRDAEKTLVDRTNELGETQEKWERETLSSPPSVPGDENLLVRLDLDGSLAILGEGSVASAGLIHEGTTDAIEPEYVEHRSGKALALDGRAHVSVPWRDALNKDDRFSFGAWVKTGEDGAVLSRMEKGPGFKGFDLCSSGGRFEVHLVHRHPDDAIKVKTKERFGGNVWRHVMVTYDGSGKASGVRLHVDGTARNVEVEKDGLSGDFATDGPIRIGSGNDEGGFVGQLDDIRIYGGELTGEQVRLIAFNGVMPIIGKSRGNRSDEERNDLQRFYRENYAVDFLRAEDALEKARKAKADLVAAIPTTMIMEEMVPPRETHLLVRGDFRNKGERVFPGTPAYLPPLRKAIAENRDGRLRLFYQESDGDSAWVPDRLDLAAWLVSAENPLTARVTVNRYWAMFFGTGLVKTLNDFGSQGGWPSHPGLLDWLACRFRDGDRSGGGSVKPWDVKALVRLMVTSRTYRQSAVGTPEKIKRDPYNRLLTRSGRRQLDAEFVRDNALAISGLLDPRIGGPSVKPYQPPGIWDGTDSVFVQDHGEDLYRRGMYVFWRRSAHYPSFATFDAPNREVCTFTRQRTQTPLQSLVLMNDPAFVECARGLAQRVMLEKPGDADGQLMRAFRLTLGRAPASDEIAVLGRSYRQQLDSFESDGEAAEAFLAVGESGIPSDIDAVRLAAMTAVANVLLNLNETITR